MDVVRSGPDNFASIMFQYPPPDSAVQSPLLESVGLGSFGSYSEYLQESVNYGMQLKNISGEKVTLQRATLLQVSEGGFTWFIVDEVSAYGTVLGHPLDLPVGYDQTNFPPFSRNASPPVSQSYLVIYATTASGKSQWLVTHMLHHHILSGPVTPAHANAPVYVGVIEPLKAVVYADNKVQVPIVGMIANPSGQKITVERLHMRLKDISGKTLFDSNLPLSFLVNKDVNGGVIDPALENDPMQDNDTPIASFLKHIEVPRSFLSGTLRIELNVKMGELCFADSRDITVGHPKPVMVQPPVKGIWHWGNGSNALKLNGHSWPEQQFNYDIGIRDSNGSTLKPDPGTDPLFKENNDNYYCFGQPVYAMLEGDVVYVNSQSEDNYGNKKYTPTQSPNIMFIKSGDVVHIYAHMKKGSMKNTSPDKEDFKVGDAIAKGQQIGLCGNSGGTTEPHLHFGVFSFGPDGYMRSLPMVFSSLMDTSSKVVNFTPLDDTDYNSVW
jgi:hypothetical protein